MPPACTCLNAATKAMAVLIGDCLESLKFSDLTLYQEAILVRHELFIKDFCEKRFLAWCDENRDAILKRNASILFVEAYKRLLVKIWHALPAATQSRVWKFLETPVPCP